MSLEARWQAQLDRLRAQGRYRRLTPPTGIDFSSNYLLLNANPRRPPTDGQRSGCASRLLRGHHAVWDNVEAALAQWHGAEAALVFTSGYSANEGLLGTIVEPGDWVASDACNHASIIDGLRLSKAERFVYRHNDLEHLEQGLRVAAQLHTAIRERFIVTESLFGMEGDRAPLAALAELAARFGAHLIVDEAHATGCFGANGGGLVDAAGLRQRVLATVHTGGKALGVPGAYVVGSASLRELLVNRCRHLIFTTALPPIVGQWWLQMLERIPADDAARAGLHMSARAFRDSLAAHGIVAGGRDYIVPLVLGDDARAVQAAQRLQLAGFDIRAIRPPTVADGAARIRISIHAGHDRDTLLRLAGALAPIVQEPRCVPAATGRNRIAQGNALGTEPSSRDKP
jgi:8-amino-7-oxononanoate synthase